MRHESRISTYYLMLRLVAVSRWKQSVGPLAQSAERGADNANVASSTLTRTTTVYFYFVRFLVIVIVV